MTEKPPYLTLVDPGASSDHDQEFTPLPYFPWDERPQTLLLDADEAATAIHLAHGDVAEAARLLKVPIVRLTRLVRNSPRLVRVQEESLQTVLAKARSVPIQTLFDPNADQRAREWASTRVLQSRLAIGDPLSPAPASSAQSNASLTVNQQTRTIQFRWRTDADDATLDSGVDTSTLINNERADD
jgi:hypothetical protein